MLLVFEFMARHSGQDDLDPQSASFNIRRADSTSMKAHNPLRDRQAQSCTVGFVATRLGQAVEGLEDASELFLRHARAMVAHNYDRLIAADRRYGLKKHFDRRAGRGEPEGIAQHILDCAAQETRISEHRQVCGL